MNNLRDIYARGFGLFGRFIGGQSIWEFDWDVLTILDGCRLDIFEDEFQGSTDSIYSVASTSHTWLSKTFEGHDTSNVGYISGNPYATDLNGDEFGYFHLEPVQMTDYDIETVPPEPLTERGISVWRQREKYDIDKLIIHYMQPHAPFREHPEWFSEWTGTDGWGSGIWSKLAEGTLDKEEFFDAYRDNLRWVLEGGGVNTLQENCDASIGITADHGNAAGEWGFYGHPVGCLSPSVRRVPWATVQGEDERTVIPTIEETSTKVDREQQLKALGYK